MQIRENNKEICVNVIIRIRRRKVAKFKQQNTKIHEEHQHQVIGREQTISPKSITLTDFKWWPPANQRPWKCTRNGARRSPIARFVPENLCFFMNLGHSINDIKETIFCFVIRCDRFVVSQKVK